MSETILFFGYSEWSNWRGHHDLAIEFSKINRVAFVEVMSRYDYFSLNGLKSIFKKLLDNHPRRLTDNLVVLPSIPILPYALPIFSKIWRKKIAILSIRLSKKLQAWYSKRQLKALSWNPTIVIFCEAFDLFHAGCFGESISCYRTYDEITNFFSNRYIADVIDDIEVNYIHKAELVFASSRAQYEKRKPLHPNVFLIPNAANFTHFHMAFEDSLAKPQDLQEISSPIIGYVGVFDFRIDLGLIEKVARSYPGWSVVFIGPVREYLFREWQEGVLKLNKLQNIYFLGTRDFKFLPAYMKYFDVCTIPFLINNITNTMYPYKLHEYLATGSPVVSTDLYELKPLEGVVRRGKSKEEFINMLKEELQTNSASKAEKRIEVARQNSWAVRAEQMLSLVNRKRDQKYANPTN